MDRAQLVGRADVLARLEDAIAAPGTGNGPHLLVGEAGSGKSAVLATLAARALASRVPVAQGRCWPDPTAAPAYWPWVQVVRAATGNDRAELAPGGLSSQLLASGDRFELFDEIRRTLDGAAAAAGLLVLIDDLHWADDGSLILLEFLARHPAGGRVTIVGAYRDDVRSPALQRAAGSAEVIDLEPLTPEESRAFIATVTPRPLPDDVVTDVVRRCGGNPLFLRELTRLVATSDGRPVHDLRRLVTVHDAVDDRLSRLSAGCRVLLEAASVLGHGQGGEVSVVLLGGLLDHGHPRAEHVEEARAARILTSDDPGTLRFVHDLFREVVLGAIPPERRAELHLATGRAIEQRGGAAPAILAAHYSAAAIAGQHSAAADAVRWSRDAAREATRRLAHEAAATHVQRALDVLALVPSPDVDIVLDLQLELGRELDASGRATEARAVLLDAADTARRAGATASSSRIAIALHRLGSATGLPRDGTVRLLEEALATTDADDASRAWLSACLARELHHSWEDGAMHRARMVAAEAVLLAENVGDPSTLGFSLLAMHDASWEPGSAAERLPIAERMQALAVQAGDQELHAQAHLLRATALLELGHPGSLDALHAYCRSADELGHARGRWGALTRRAAAAAIEGRLDEAEDLAAQAGRLGREIGEPDTDGVWDTMRWSLALIRGGIEVVEPGEHWVPSASWPPHRALRLVLAGDHGGARDALVGYSVRQAYHGARRHDGWPATVVAEAVAAVGDEEQISETYEWLSPLTGVHLVYGGCMGYGGAVDRHLGRLARALGRDDAAARHLDAARRMHSMVGATGWADLVERTSEASTYRSTGPPTENALERDGDLWTASFHGRRSTVRHLKGLVDLAVLLEHPGREVSCIDLMGGVDTDGTRGPALDDVARRQYGARIAELRAEIESARERAEWSRVERAESELDMLVEQLSGAFGLGGRPRPSGSTSERARVAVTHRLRSAVRRLGDADPGLGRHLENAVKTGHWCVYRPDVDMAWRVVRDHP